MLRSIALAVLTVIASNLPAQGAARVVRERSAPAATQLRQQLDQLHRELQDLKQAVAALRAVPGGTRAVEVRPLRLRVDGAAARPETAPKAAAAESGCCCNCDCCRRTVSRLAPANVVAPRLAAGQRLGQPILLQRLRPGSFAIGDRNCAPARIRAVAPQVLQAPKPPKAPKAPKAPRAPKTKAAERAKLISV